MSNSFKTYSLLAVPVKGKTQRLDPVRAPVVVCKGTPEDCVARAKELHFNADTSFTPAYLNGLRLFSTRDWVYYIV